MNNSELNKDQVYDVAFSFIKDDEILADEINQVLKTRISTFIYSEHQAELVGTDGEKVLNKIFHDNSRIVCVLYRKGWGESPWTRIEETAIKNRAYDNGYDFSIFIPLDNSPMPKWLPKTFIWYGMERYGIEGLSSIVETKVQEHGGKVHYETPVDKITSYLVERKDEDARKQLLWSTEGVALAKQEIEKLFGAINAIVEKVNKIRVFPERDNRMVMFLNGYSIDLIWIQQYSNTTQYATLYSNMYKGFPGITGRVLFEDPKLLDRWRYKFGVTIANKPCWVNSINQKKYLTNELLSYLVDELVNHMKKDNSNQ